MIDLPKDPDEDEVNRAMTIGLGTTPAVVGAAYVSILYLSRRWNKPTVPTPVPGHTRVPEVVASGSAIADNRAANEILPGTFIEQDDEDQDMSPDDLTKPFWQDTEQDVANMKAA